MVSSTKKKRSASKVLAEDICGDNNRKRVLGKKFPQKGVV
jgi:hypothetical protein